MDVKFSLVVENCAMYAVRMQKFKTILTKKIAISSISVPVEEIQEVLTNDNE